MNWGQKLALGLGIFMLFIVGLGAYMFTKQGNDTLIDDNYYENGLNYSQDYKLQQNAIKDNAIQVVEQSASQLVIKLKDSATYTLSLKRLANAKSDRKLTGNTLGKTNIIVIPLQNFDKGVWALNLVWNTQSQKYMFKKEIVLQ